MSTNREFLLNVVLLLGINLLIKPFYLFGIDRVVQNTLPAGVYGLYFLLFGFAYLFQVINDFGIATYNSRTLSRHRQLIQKYFPTLLVLKLLLLAIYLLVLLAAGYIWGYVPAQGWLLLGIGFNLGLMALLLFLRSNLAALGRYRRDSLLSALDRLLVIVIVGAMLWVPAWRAQFQLWWFVVAQTFALLVACVVVYSSVRPHLGSFTRVWRPVRLWFFLRASAPYALVIFLMTAYTRLDAVMLGYLLPETGLLQNDHYAAAFRLLDAANSLTYLFAALLLPMFSRQLRLGRSVVPLANLSIRLLWGMAGTLAVISWYFGDAIMAFLYTDPVAESGQILAWLMIAFMGMAAAYVYGTLLTAAGALARLNIYFALGVLLNVALNWWLIPHTQALGAAQATAITQWVIFLLQLMLARRLCDLPFNGVLLLQLLAYVVLLVCCTWSIATYVAMAWFVKIMLVVVVAVLLALGLRLIRWRDSQLLPFPNQSTPS